MRSWWQASHQEDFLVRPFRPIELEPPTPNPTHVYGVGLNYPSHTSELNTDEPSDPVVFSKSPTCLVGPERNITHPGGTSFLDWEAEIVVVIGRPTSHVGEAEVPSPRRSGR